MEILQEQPFFWFLVCCFVFFFLFFPPDVCVFPLPSLAKASGAKAQEPGTPRGSGKQSTLNPQENRDRKQTLQPGAWRRVRLLAPAKGLLGDLRGLQAGTTSPIRRPVLFSCIDAGWPQERRGESARGARTGLVTLPLPSPAVSSPWPCFERQYGLKLHELKRLELSKSSTGSKLSKHSGHLAREVLFRLFIAVGAKRVQSWRQTFPKLGAIWIREGEREFSQACFQQTLTPSLRYVLLSMTH